MDTDQASNGSVSKCGSLSCADPLFLLSKTNTSACAICVVLTSQTTFLIVRTAWLVYEAKTAQFSSSRDPSKALALAASNEEAQAVRAVVGGAEWRDPGIDAKIWRMRQGGAWRGVAKVYTYMCVCV